jgi:hypothetical protein
MDAKMIAIHSKCCVAHWHLVKEEGAFTLKCSRCGKDVGPEVNVQCLHPDGITCLNDCKNDTWELVYNPETASFWLECDVCEDEHFGALVTGPDLSGIACSCCGKEICEKQTRE